MADFVTSHINPYFVDQTIFTVKPSVTYSTRLGPELKFLTTLQSFMKSRVGKLLKLMLVLSFFGFGKRLWEFQGADDL